MKTDPNPRFDVAALKTRAGETVFARGQAYHRDGHVLILAVESHRVLAEVEGSEDYRVELTGRGASIAGRCTCPAFEDRGFCKHMVATALAANAERDDGDGQQRVSPLDRIREHLKSKDAAELVQLIVSLAEEDPALFARLDLAASALGADDRRLKARLKTAIDRASRTGGYVEYETARAWANRVDDGLDAIDDLAAGPRARVALEVAEHAIDRIEEALNEVDDSDGSGGDLLGRAVAIHVAAAEAAKPDPVLFARSLFARELESDYGAFDGAAMRYANALGEPGLAEYKRLASEAWNGLPTLRAGSARGENHGSYRRLMGVLDFFAERDGDVTARIALRAKDLSSAWSYLRLAEFCRGAGRDDEALRWAEQGLWAFEDGPPDERLVDLAVGMLNKAGRTKEAEAHAWRAFEKAPSLERYRKLRDLVGQPALQRALAMLSARLAKEQATLRLSTVDTLIGILMAEQSYEAAWEAVRRHGASAGVRESLARESAITHPREALEVFTQRVDRLATLGGNRDYAEAANLVERMGALRAASEQAAYLAELKARFARKRNFMKLLA